MKQLWYRFQFLVVMILLSSTVVMAYLVIHQLNWSYDATQGKIHSLPDETIRVLKQLESQPLEVLAFYPKDDPAREGLTIFLKQVQAKHPDFHFNLYDPERRPKLAEKYKIDQNYTTLVQSGDHEERIYIFTEESFTNALFRIAHPRKLDLCFTTGHQETALESSERNGATGLVKNLQNGEISVYPIVLSRDEIPDTCSVTIVAGPHQEFDPSEFKTLEDAFKQGKSLVFLIDPMDLGAGRKFTEFFQKFGVSIGENVLVDNTSRIAGGDSLMPLVVNYSKHVAVRRMKEPTFFPVVRTVQPSTEMPEHLEVFPLAFTNEGSWAETDLVLLEDGKSSFDVKEDLAGPLSIAVAVEAKGEDAGRMVIVGDSDFITNGYISLSKNLDFAMEILKWAGRDSRFIHVNARRAPFEPLLMKEYQKQGLLFLVLGVYPLALFIPIGLYLIIRSRTA